MTVRTYKSARTLIWMAITLALFSIPVPHGIVSTSIAQPFATVSVLYDGALNTGTLDRQGFLYLTYPLTNTQATQAFTSPVTMLDTTPQMSDYAGYFANPTLYPSLDRVDGYQVLFTVQVMSETHISLDRAGFSLLVTSSDKRGIELGFWENEVWAQEGGSINPFTHAESAPFTRTTDLIAYRLTVMGERYMLAADGLTVLS